MAKRAPPLARVDAMPGGNEWRRAATQLATRLGSYPGDRVLIFAPPERDPAPHLVRRLPRVRMIRIEDDPAGLADPAEPPIDAEATPIRIRMALDAPAFKLETIDACVVVFAVPLLPDEKHEEFVADWAPVLAPFGKWHELVSVTGPHDHRLAAAEEALRIAGFEKVRSLRLALGRRGRALYMVQGRWPGSDLDDDEDHDEGDDDDDDDE